MALINIPRADHWSETRIARILHPMQEFIHQSTSTGIILLISTAVALFFANVSGLSDWYHDFQHVYLFVGLTDPHFGVDMSVLHWINDGLMVIFFFVVGLEIKREVLVGELANVRAALLPIAAALGGVIAPALIYLFFNFGTPAQSGWGIPMATDIAFAIGCLALLGNRVPFALKVFLTAVAIVDDLMAVLVIAIFYSGGLNYTALGIGFLFLGVLFIANRLGFRYIPLYVSLGVVVWLAFLESGVHATIAGVLVALTVPSRYQINEKAFLAQAKNLLKKFEESDSAPSRMLTDERQQGAVFALEAACEQVQAPLQKLEHTLHGWVSFLIMPLFAFANAGVHISLEGFGGENTSLVLGIVLGLTVGKPIGIFGASWLAVRSGLASLPSGVTWRQIFGVSILGGIGFTMSLFIASLGFANEPHLLDGAKLAILLASAIAGVVGLLVLMVGAPESEEGTEQSVASHGAH